MSFVGTRPEAVKYVEKELPYRDREDFYTS